MTPVSTRNAAPADSPKNTTKRTRTANKSPYFSGKESPAKRAPRKNLSCIPFPPLTTPAFGLAQERLRRNPFQLLVACVFLTKTRGAVSMPVFFRLITQYPTVEALAQARLDDVVDIFSKLGLQNQRAKRVIGMAQAWRSFPPEKGKRFRVLNYPGKGDGRDVKPAHPNHEGRDDGAIADDDERVAWEIGHIPGVGAYALDSWRIFCRDELRQVESCDGACAQIVNGKGKATANHAPEGEWTGVVPLDKELRAYLRWRWLKHGWVWNPLTGAKRKASRQELAKAEQGGVIVEADDGGGIEIMDA